MTSIKSGYRVERDALGEKRLPRDCLWGIHTERARENFLIAGRPVHPALVSALARVKKACCEANARLGFLSPEKAVALAAACDEVVEGKLAYCFPVDALQGGAGTSTNMNLNEVLANRAAVILGGRPGDYRLVDPIEDVNLHQSTNDVYPTALKVAAIYRLRELSRRAASLQGAFQRKENLFAGVVKIGRTELQEAVPLTMGREFAAFAEALARDRWRVFKCEERLRVVNIGGTAVGTGLGAPRRYIFLVIELLREMTGLGLARAENPVDPTANADVFVEASGILKAHAGNLVKVAGDLRLLNLLGEVTLNGLQAGSSIMPGKVNPVAAEAVIQAGLGVFAADLALTGAVSRGTLQICEFMPLVADSLLGSLDLLERADGTLEAMVDGMAADPDRCRDYLENSPALFTVLLPVVGYHRAGELLAEFRASGRRRPREFLEEKLGRETVTGLLSPHRVAALGYREGESGQGKDGGPGPPSRAGKVKKG